MTERSFLPCEFDSWKRSECLCTRKLFYNILKIMYDDIREAKSRTLLSLSILSLPALRSPCFDVQPFMLYVFHHLFCRFPSSLFPPSVPFALALSSSVPTSNPHCALMFSHSLFPLPTLTARSRFDTPCSHFQPSLRAYVYTLPVPACYPLCSLPPHSRSLLLWRFALSTPVFRHA